MAGILHSGGELYFLTCCFDNDGSLPASQFFFGLDNRSTILVTDLMTDLVEEPSGHGYLRQSVSTTSGFTISLVDGIYTATCEAITFSATTGSWGPVSTLFLATSSDNSGVLLASAPLSNSITPTSGLSFSMRMSLSLKDAT